MVLLSFDQSIYISLLILGVLVILLLLFLLYYRNYFKKKNLNAVVARHLYRYANINDYLLLNNYRIHIDDNHIGKIDHVLVTNKYIIVINDFSISGVLEGDYSHGELKLTNKKGSAKIVNPLNYNINLTKRVAMFNNLDNSFLRGIVVINDDSIINVTNMPNQFKLIKKKDLNKTIKEIDGNDVKPFKEETIVRFINSLEKQNERMVKHEK